MKFKAIDRFIYRVPQFPIDAKIEDCWIELKDSIKISAPDFYKIIAGTNSDQIKHLPDKIKTTIWKYFNRSKFRSVPYGTFAGIGIAELNNPMQSLIIEAGQRIKNFVDWPYKSNFTYTFSHVLETDAYLLTNSSYYLVANRIRYIYNHEGNFELSDIESSDLTLKILRLTRKPSKISYIITRLAKDVEHSLAKEYLADLISLQLLHTSLDPNLIGEDYFDRLGFNQSAETPKYTIAIRDYLHGNLDTETTKNIPSLISLLANYSKPPKTPKNLEAFIRKFSRKFDQREIPIMAALDPEIGIGYGNLENPAKSGDLIGELLHHRSERFQNHTKNKLTVFLQSEVIKLNSDVVYLDELITARQPNESKGGPIPNTVSAIFSESNGLLHMTKLGGYSPNQFMGRFTIADNEIQQFCRDMAEIEISANPEILFFDISYMSELRYDNINRRRDIYNHQLAIMNYNESKNPITLDDILISVRGEKVFLRSKRLGVRLVPRMSSAYNYNRSDLPVFRLLCDLMYHGIQTDFTVDLLGNFPDLSFSPRIQFKNIVVSPARWRLSTKDHDKANFGEWLNSELKRLNVSRYIKIGVADQTLLIDTHHTNDIQRLAKLLDKHHDHLIEEAFEQDSTSVKDNDNRRYAAQFLYVYKHHEPVYTSYSPTKNVQLQLPAFFAPGSRWLYFEIFISPTEANEMIKGDITSLLVKFKKDIKKWFFIRYNENGDHLRIRLELKRNETIGIVVTAFNKILKPRMDSGIISDMQIKTYKREMERYSIADIRAVETHFCTDSIYAIELLSLELSDVELYRICIQLIKSLLPRISIPQSDLYARIKTFCFLLNEEHQITTEGFKSINTFFRNHNFHIESPIPTTISYQFNTLLTSFIFIIEKCAHEGRLNLFSDLIHMHINRVFPLFQRMHETIIYNILRSILEREIKMIQPIKITKP